jgi:transposase
VYKLVTNKTNHPTRSHGPKLSRLDAAAASRAPKKIDLDSWRASNKSKSGRKFKDLDNTLNGIWWILRTGSQWNQLPRRFGKWNSVYRQHNRWSHEGFWQEALEMLTSEEQEDDLLSIDATYIKAHQDACRHASIPEKQALGKTKGGRNSKLNAVVNGAGKLLRMMLVPGNEHEVKRSAEVLGNNLKGAIILGDRGYVSDELAHHILESGGYPNITPRKNMKDPLPYHKELGKLRHVVENFFARIKRSRRVDTRYDKLTATYLSFVTLAAIDDWVRF